MKCYIGRKENEIFILGRVKERDGRSLEDFHYTVKPGEQFYGLSYDQLQSHVENVIEVDHISLL